MKLLAEGQFFKAYEVEGGIRLEELQGWGLSKKRKYVVYKDYGKGKPLVEFIKEAIRTCGTNWSHALVWSGYGSENNRGWKVIKE